jgi:hypothetical protein
MKKIILLLMFTPLLLATTCDDNDDDNQIVCTQEAKAGLNVSVSLGNMNSITSEGVTVIATDGNYTETLSVINNTDPIFFGAWERIGTYIITVSKEGYQTYTTAPITLTADQCHVIPQFINVALIQNN